MEEHLFNPVLFEEGKDYGQDSEVEDVSLEDAQELEWALYSQIHHEVLHGEKITEIPDADYSFDEVQILESMPKPDPPVVHHEVRTGEVSQENAMPIVIQPHEEESQINSQNAIVIQPQEKQSQSQDVPSEPSIELFMEGMPAKKKKAKPVVVIGDSDSDCVVTSPPKHKPDVIDLSNQVSPAKDFISIRSRRTGFLPKKIVINRRKRFSSETSTSSSSSDSSLGCEEVQTDIALNVAEPEKTFDSQNYADLQDVLDHLGDGQWKIDSKDRYHLKESRRYYKNDVQCHNCKERGHISNMCPKPKVLVCILCGEIGHTEYGCDSKLCFNCSAPGHSKLECPFPRCGHRDLCRRCRLYGHNKEFCPERWRQYHITTKEGTIVVPNVQEENPRRFCYNCGKRGHFGMECHSSTMDRYVRASMPFINEYDEPSERESRSDYHSSDCAKHGTKRHRSESPHSKNKKHKSEKISSKSKKKQEALSPKPKKGNKNSKTSADASSSKAKSKKEKKSNSKTKDTSGTKKKKGKKNKKEDLSISVSQSGGREVTQFEDSASTSKKAKKSKKEKKKAAAESPKPKSKKKTTVATPKNKKKIAADSPMPKNKKKKKDKKREAAVKSPTKTPENLKNDKKKGKKRKGDSCDDYQPKKKAKKSKKVPSHDEVWAEVDKQQADPGSLNAHCESKKSRAENSTDNQAHSGNGRVQHLKQESSDPTHTRQMFGKGSDPKEQPRKEDQTPVNNGPNSQDLKQDFLSLHQAPLLKDPPFPRNHGSKSQKPRGRGRGGKRGNHQDFRSQDAVYYHEQFNENYPTVGDTHTKSQYHNYYEQPKGPRGRSQPNKRGRGGKQGNHQHQDFHSQDRAYYDDNMQRERTQHDSHQYQNGDFYSEDPDYHGPSWSKSQRGKSQKRGNHRGRGGKRQHSQNLDQEYCETSADYDQQYNGHSNSQDYNQDLYSQDSTHYDQQYSKSSEENFRNKRHNHQSHNQEYPETYYDHQYYGRQNSQDRNQDYAQNYQSREETYSQYEDRYSPEYFDQPSRTRSRGKSKQHKNSGRGFQTSDSFDQQNHREGSKRSAPKKPHPYKPRGRGRRRPGNKTRGKVVPRQR